MKQTLSLCVCLFVVVFCWLKMMLFNKKKWNEVKWDAKNINSTCQLSLFVLFFFKKLDNNKLFVCSFFFLVWSVKFCQDQREMMIIITIKIKSKEAKSKRHKSYTHTHWEKNISKFSHPFLFYIIMIIIVMFGFHVFDYYDDVDDDFGLRLYRLQNSIFKQSSYKFFFSFWEKWFSFVFSWRWFSNSSSSSSSSSTISLWIWFKKHQ